MGRGSSRKGRAEAIGADQELRSPLGEFPRQPFPIAALCITLSYMSAITVRLDEQLELELADLAQRTGRSKSELIRDALRRQLAIARFQSLRETVAPFAEAQGWLTDEDIFRDVS